MPPALRRIARLEHRARASHTPQAVSRTGQDFGVDSYWRVQSTIESAIAVLRDHKPTGAEVFLFYGRADEIYVAVLKPTRNPVTSNEELYVDSFRRSSLGELERQRQRLESVR